MGGAVRHVDSDRLDAEYTVRRETASSEVKRTHWKGTLQYSANMVQTMLMTMSLRIISLVFITHRKSYSLVLSVAVVSMKMLVVLPGTILEPVCHKYNVVEIDDVTYAEN